MIVNKCLNVLFYICTVGVVASMLGMESKTGSARTDRLMEFGRNVALGSITGVTEVGVNQPLIYIKNALQQGKGVACDPRVWYRGFSVNAVCMAPTTAIQVATNEALKQVAPGTDTMTSVARAFAAGAISALASTPTELVILCQQNEGKSAYQTVRGLVAQAGYAGLMRGITPKALRDGGFGVGFLSMYSQMEEQLYAITASESLATIGAGVGAGTVTAIVTHPFDTVSTDMQADTKKELATMWQAIKATYAKDGPRGFYRGVVPRGTRVALAICIMNKVQNALNELTGEINSRVDN